MDQFQFEVNEFSDDDEEIVEFIEFERRPYVLRERHNYFESFDDKDFFLRFRLKKETVLNILVQIEPQIETLTDRNKSVSPMNQLLVALRFYATGSFLITVGDFINISKSTACNIVKKVSRALACLSPRYIRMPQTAVEIAISQQRFFVKARLPRVIGSLDCTHVKIQSPGGFQPEIFRNRKGYFSLNVQTISSADLKILDIVARWPGSTHDQIILNNSNVYHRIHANEFGNSLIVADSGYEDTAHIVTPVDVVHNQTEELYNESVRRTRNPVERQYGIWKRRFPILALGMRQKLPNIQIVIVACAVLHNIALEQNEEMPPDDHEVIQYVADFDEDHQLERNNHIGIGITAKDILLADYFPGLIR